MTTLIYIGLNHGAGFQKILSTTNYDRYIGFEPIPYLSQSLKEKYKNDDRVEIIEAAITEISGQYNFYITDVDGSSSLYEVTSSWREFTGNKIQSINKIKVNGINILDFLKERNIDFIDHYISDAEGNDYIILSYLEKFIDDKKISLIQVESEMDYVNYEQRKNQPKNKEKDFLDLLEKNYTLYYKQEGNYDDNSPNKWANRDLFFKLK
jgi:FkbM family methyltransferase